MHEDILLPTFGLAIHTAMMIYTSLALIVFAWFFGRKLTLIPGKTQGIAELMHDFFDGLVDETMGHKGKKYLPLVLTIAVFIFFANVTGFIPGLVPPTANLNTTLGLALVVFFATHIIGVREHGFKYFKHFVGPVWWLAPLMIPIEIIGHIARPVSLSLRLFGNMMGHERIVGVLLILMPFAYPLLAMSTLLGVLVVFIQTFIFALLSMMYFGAALEETH